MLFSNFEYPSLLQSVFVIVVFWTLKMLRALLRSSKTPSKTVEEKNWKKDTVYLYQFKPVSFMPNLSPFCLKLETWLRLHKIPYENRYTMTSRLKYGKIPFVELNGEHLADSQLILLTLQKHFKIQDNLSSENAAYARALDRLADGHTFYLLVRLKIENAAAFITMMLDGLPSSVRPVVANLLAPFMSAKMKSRVRECLGNFSDVEFRNLLGEDLEAFKNALGTKKFLFGDSISAVDCTVFGQLATAYYPPQPTYPKEQLSRPECKVLVDYLERIKHEVWGNDFTKH